MILSLWRLMSREEGCISLTDEAWSFLELKEDSLFAFLKQEEYAVHVCGAMNDGKKKAAGLTMNQITHRMGQCRIQVKIVKGKNPIQVHSQTLWNKGTLKVELFETVIEEIVSLLDKKGISMTWQEIRDLHLAHEYYHCMEYLQERQISCSLPPVCYRTIGIIKRQGYLNRTREIAAHMFAKEVCACPFHPKYLDVLLWEEQDKEFTRQYDEECRKADNWARRMIYGRNCI